MTLALVVAATLTQEAPNRPVAIELGVGAGAGGLTSSAPIGDVGGPALQLGIAAISEMARPLTFFARADAHLFANATGGMFSAGSVHVGARLNLGQTFYLEAGFGLTSFNWPPAFTLPPTTGMRGFSGEVAVGARGGDLLHNACALRTMGGPLVDDLRSSGFGFSIGLACSLSWPAPAS